MWVQGVEGDLVCVVYTPTPALEYGCCLGRVWVLLRVWLRVLLRVRVLLRAWHLLGF